MHASRAGGGEKRIPAASPSRSETTARAEILRLICRLLLDRLILPALRLLLRCIRLALFRLRFLVDLRAAE